jgi:hypothetical protein
MKTLKEGTYNMFQMLISSTAVFESKYHEHSWCWPKTACLVLSREAQYAFARVLDCVRDYMDVRDVASKAQMLKYGDELQRSVEALAAGGQALFIARRRVTMTRPVAKALS